MLCYVTLCRLQVHTFVLQQNLNKVLQFVVQQSNILNLKILVLMKSTLTKILCEIGGYNFIAVGFG